MKKHLERLIPGSLKPTLKRIYYLPLDLIDRLRGRDSMTPSRSMMFVGDGDFEKIGKEFKSHFIDLADLRPDGRVLDVGCGIGRMAVPLTSYIAPEGEYWGFDIVRRGIQWCQRHISSRYPNFHFLHCDVYNKHYNKSGRIPADRYQFPFEPEFFDFVFLTSVFTHMLPAALEHYLSEISRVLRTGGRCLITFFLLNEESERLIESGHSALDFRYEIEGCRTTNKNNPEAAIAYSEESIKGLFEKHGLSILQPIHYGSWCERGDFLVYQDIIVAEKADPAG